MSDEPVPRRKNASTPAETRTLIESDLFPMFRRHANATWSPSRQIALADDLKRLISEAGQAREHMRHSDDGASATAWREIEVILEAMESELRMWIAVGEKNAAVAWEHLVDAQQSAEFASTRLEDYKPASQLVEHLAEVERIVFPEQFFVSPSMIVPSFHCSICKAVYGSCNHLAGEIYDGETAHQVADRIDDAREVSVVNDPASKRHRFLSYDGFDLLTGEPVEAGSGHEPTGIRKGRQPLR